MEVAIFPSRRGVLMNARMTPGSISSRVGWMDPMRSRSGSPKSSGPCLLHDAPPSALISIHDDHVR